MSTFNTASSRNRDMQDVFERHAFEDMEPVDGGGHVVRVKGSGGTQDEEAFVMFPGGLGIRPPKGSNVEVHLLSSGSDTQLKYAIVTIPHDKEHKWKEGQNGLQKWDDPDRRLEWNNRRFHVTDENVAFGPNGIFEIKDGKVYIRGELHVAGNVYGSAEVHAQASVRTPTLAPPDVPPIPGFEGT